MLADVAVAGGADRGISLIGLLHHRAEHAGELRKRALQDRLAKVDVAEHTLARILQSSKRRDREESFRAGGEMRRGGEGAVLLAAEVMKETALREPRATADIVDRRRRIALRADHVDRSLEQSRACCLLDR